MRSIGGQKHASGSEKTESEEHVAWSPEQSATSSGTAQSSRERARGSDKKDNVASARSSAKLAPVKERARPDKTASIPDSIDAEIQMQSMLAKKLKGQSRTGPDDGLDALLAGFEDLNGSARGGTLSMPQLPEEEYSIDSDDPGFFAMGDIGAGSNAGAEASDDTGSISKGMSGMSDEVALQSISDKVLNQDGVDSEQREASPITDMSRPVRSAPVKDKVARKDDGSRGDIPLPSDSGCKHQGTGSLADQDIIQQGDQDRAKSRPQTKKYVPPALRGTVKSTDQTEVHRAQDSEQTAAQRQIRKLFNRVAASNLMGIASEISSLFGSMPRYLVIETIVQALMQALEEGPRAADQFAAVMACLIVMVSALSNVQELLAKVMLALAHGLEKSRVGGDSIASSNTVRVVCCVYLCKGIGSRVIYSLLEHLKQEFTDSDVHLVLLVLQTVGYQLRGDDAVGMKALIESVHAKSATLKASNSLSQRARLMLELIVDLKNNRKRKNMGGHVGLEATVPPATLKQLRDCNADAMALHYITWPQLCYGDHRGTWWLPHASDVSGQVQDMAQPVATVSLHPESSALLQLASQQRMNTDIRRAIFCVLMSADDNMDAVERLMRLPLKATAARDIAHVLLHCCMQEERWNPFYAHVACELLSHGKAYRSSFQFAVQDQARRVPELNARQATNLASLLAHLLARQGLPLSVLKVLELQQPSKRCALFCRYCLQRLLLNLKSDGEIQILFSKLHNAELRTNLHSFIRDNMGPWLANLDPSDERDFLLLRIQTVEMVLKAVK